MATPINLPVNAQLQNQTQLQRQILQATQNLRINFATGNSARSLGALSQPLGRLTGQADEFSKSLDAANARVLAFGASVGIVNTLSNAFKSLVTSTIEVEKAITAISVVGDQFAGKNKQLSQGLFSIAKATGQSFAEVSKAALEFSRQGLKLEDTLQRTQDALILTRLTGLDASKSVDGLTASVNAFSKAGLSTTQILNKLAAVDQAFAVSSADLIEGFNRSAAVAQNAGVTFDELAGIITALQQETSRGGAVIGNALKTIFTRLQDTSTLNQLRGLGVAVQDLEGNLLPARQILQNLAKDVEGLGQITRAGVFKDVAGTFQINQLISLVGDLGKANSVSAKATQVAAGATNEAFIANEKLNQSLDAIINKVALTGKQLGALLGEIGLGDNLKGILDGINSFLEGATNLLQGDDLGSRFAKGIIKGIGSVLTGPGIGLFLAIIAKLSFDLAKFGVQSLKTFFGIGQAAKQQQQVQESIVQTLIRNQSVLSQILNTQGGQNAQAQAFLNILKQEEQVLQNIRTIAAGIAAPLVQQGYRAGAQGIQRRSAGGYLPAQEASDVRRGVGGASPNSKVVAIPNFAFGGGKRGTMIANTSEYIVPNYAGGGSAIFNQDMAKTMGLPPGAKKITASGGFVPNFASATLNQRQQRIKYNKFSVSDLPSLELAGQADPFDNFSGEINIIQQKRTNQEYDKLSQRVTGKILTKLGASTGKDVNVSYKDKLIEYFKKRDIDPSSILGLETSIAQAQPGGGFINVKNRIKGIFGEIDASKLSGKSLTQDNAYLDLVGGGEVKTRKVTPLRNLIKKVANTYLSKNYIRDGDEDFVNAPPLPLYIPATDNLKQSIDLKASGGYIPNFANYVYDSDRLGGDKQKILQAILDSTKKKDLLVGPAGAGKSTLGSGLGTFISSIDDISKASSFTILSGAALTKEKGLSQDLRAKLAAVQASGGKVSYLGVTNQELLSRREKRATEGSVEGDLRSAAQLAGSKLAPLNQGAFIRQLKRSSSNFELLRESKQQASTNQQLAILGLYGENGNINGSPVYTLKSQRPNLFKDIEGNLKKNVTNLVKAYANRIGKKIGIPVGAKDIKKSLTQIPSLSGYMFEDVLNQLAGPNFDTATESSGSRIDFPLTKNLREVFGVTGSQIYAEAKLNPYSPDALKSIADKQLALAGGAQGPVERSGDLISGLKAKYLAYKNLPGRTKGNAENKAIFNQIVNSLGLDPTTPRDTLVKQIERILGAAAEGYIPNFAASALLDAISREKSAGLSASQIYVDQSPALKSSSNPMGLMVANRRDEPAGGFQGIARARKEGMNPKTYGAARGFVPNYAPVQASDFGTFSPKITSSLDQFADLINKLNKELSENKITFDKAQEAVDNFVKGIKSGRSNLDPSKGKGQQLAEAGKSKLELPQEVKEGFADLAGKLVTAQTAISFLNGALEGTGGKLEQFGTSVVDVVGKMGQLIFLLQGTAFGQALLGSVGKLLAPIGTKISDLFTGLAARVGLGTAAGGVAAGGAAAGLAAAAAPVALAAGAAYLVRGIGESIKDLRRKSGVTEAFEALAASADEAASSFTNATKINAAAAVALSNQFEGNIIPTLQQVALEISTLGFGDFVQKGGFVYEDVNLKEEQSNAIIDKIIASYAATGLSREDALQQAQFLIQSQKTTQTSQTKLGGFFTKTDLTEENTAKNINLELKRLAIVARAVKAQDDLAAAQATYSDEVKVSTNFLKNNAESIKNLTLRYNSLKDAIQNIEIESIFAKSLNKSLIDLNSGLSETQRNFSEFQNSIQDINLDFATDKSKKLAEALADISGNALKELRNGFGQLSKDATPAILEIEKAFVEAFESGDIEKFGDKYIQILKANNIGNLTGSFDQVKQTLFNLRDQTEELDRQTAIKRVQAQLDFSAKTLIDQKTLAEERLTQALEKRTKTLEQNYSIDQEILKIRRDIEDTQFERSLIGLSESAKLSKQKTRADTVERRRGEEDVINSFRETVAGAITNLTSEIPSNLSFEDKQAIRGRILTAQGTVLNEQNPELPANTQLDILQGIGQQNIDDITKAIQEAEKKASDLAFENAKLTTEMFDAAIQSSALSFASIIEQSAYAFRKANLQAQLAEAEQEPEKIINDPYLPPASKGPLVTAAENEIQRLRYELSQLGENPQLTAQRAALTAKINELEKQRIAIQKQAAEGQEQSNAAMAAGNQLTGQRSLADIELTARGEKATTTVLSLAESLSAMTSIAQNLSNKIRDYFDSLPGEIAGLQFSALQSTSPDDLASNLIQQDVLLNNKGQEKENVASIAEQTALRQKSFELATAESASRRRELEIELEYLKEFFRIKEETKNLSEEERIAAFAEFKRRQTEEQRTFGAGLGRGFAQVQTDVDNFQSQLGEQIPQLFSDNLAQGLNDAISGAKSLKDALRDAATSFFQEITRQNISNLAKMFTSGIGNVAKGFFAEEKAAGGLISGGSGIKDDVPAMLMGGEYVIKKSAVKKYGSNFLDALNSGSIKGFANGGGVQSGTGGFYVPGDYGTGGIRGKRQLLSFATQSFTSGQYDTMGGFGIGGASVSLEAESSRLSQFGRQNNPMFERVQESKQQAFDVYLQQLKQEEQYEEQLKEIEQREKERQKQLVTSIVSAVASFAISAAASKIAGDAKAGALNAETEALNAGPQRPQDLAAARRSGAFGNIFKGAPLTPAAQQLQMQRTMSQFSPAQLDAMRDFLSKATLPTNSSSYTKQNLSGYGSSSFKFGPEPPLPTGGPNFQNSLLPPVSERYNGGYITGGSGMRDDVPAMLTGGEFVLNNRATRKLGVQNLNRLNAGETSGGEDRSGAVTESLLSKLDELIQATRDSSGDNVVVNVSSNEAGGMTESNSGNEKELQRKIRQAVLDVIAQEKRLGGSLNKDK